MKKIFWYARILSLDVVLGALASAYMVAWWLGVIMPVFFWFTFAISVWVIYTADHLLDAYRLKEKAHTPRHLFHYTYFKQISFLVVVLALFCLGLVPFLNIPVFLFGLGMGAFTLLHLLLVNWVGDRTSCFFLKELGVGLIYAVGVWGVPVLLKPASITYIDIHFFLQFFLLAMINLLTFSMYEMKTDEIDGHTSFVLAIGKENTCKVLSFLSLLIAVSAIWIFIQGLPFLGIVVQVILLFMLGILIWVGRDESRFREKEAYRVWADAVFLFPAVIILVC